MEGRVWAAVHYVALAGSAGSGGSGGVCKTSVSPTRNDTFLKIGRKEIATTHWHAFMEKGTFLKIGRKKIATTHWHAFHKMGNTSKYYLMGNTSNIFWRYFPSNMLEVFPIK